MLRPITASEKFAPLPTVVTSNLSRHPATSQKESLYSLLVVVMVASIAYAAASIRLYVRLPLLPRGGYFYPGTAGQQFSHYQVCHNGSNEHTNDVYLVDHQEGASSPGSTKQGR